MTCARVETVRAAAVLLATGCRETSARRAAGTRGTPAGRCDDNG